jgi:hypothetical protein
VVICHDGEAIVSFCDHCQGQRFDRAQVLRALRAARKRLRRGEGSREAEQILAFAIETVRTLEIPHFDPVDEFVDGEVVH